MGKSLEKGKISSTQLTILIIGFVLGTSVILTPGRQAGHDAWIAIILGLVEGLIIAWIFTALARRFKNKTLIEINEIVYGKVIGKVVSFLFIWFLIHLGAIVLNNYIQFFRLELYHETPKTIMLLILILVSASTVNRGIEVLARCSLILVPMTIFIIVLDTFLLIPEIDLNNLMPVLDLSFKQLLIAAHSAASFPFAEAVAFLMVLAFLNKPEKGPAAVAAGMTAAGLVLVIAVVRNAAVLGSVQTAFNYPSYMAVQVIDIEGVLTRLEVLVAINFITMGFLKLSVLFYGTVLGIAQTVKLKSYNLIITPVGVLIVILALTNVRNTMELIEFATQIFPIYAVPFEIGIPFITLITANLRKLPQREGIGI